MDNEARLTKKVVKDGKEYAACNFYGTESCLIHSDKTKSCAECKVCKLILYKLYEIENALEEMSNENQ